MGSLLGAEGVAVIDGIACSVFEAKDIQMVTKYRNEHLPEELRTHIKNDSTILGLLMENDEELGDGEEDWKFVEEEMSSYVPPMQISKEDYEAGDSKIRREAQEGFDEEERFLINTVRTISSQSSYNV